MIAATLCSTKTAVQLRCRRSYAKDGDAREIQFLDGDFGDRFCLDGQRLVKVGGKVRPSSEYGADGTEYRTDVDAQARIVSYGTDALGLRHS